MREKVDNSAVCGQAVARLVEKTGANRVPNFWIRWDLRQEPDVEHITVGFSPRGWTGR